MSTTPTSAQLFERACRVLPGGNSRTTVFLEPHPIYAACGSGCRITDVDGNTRIDFLNNYTSLLHGHAHPVIIEAVRAQLDRGTCFPMPTESEILLAELLCERIPSVDRIRFTNSGTEAVMMALKAARAYTGRPLIAKCEGCYHGAYDFAEVSQESTDDDWGSLERPRSVAPALGTPTAVLDNVIVIPFNVPAVAEQLLLQHADSIAAVLVDPMPNRAGLMSATPEFLQVLRRFTSRHRSILIFDEVITFRLGYHGAQNEFGVIPDLTALGKVIGGGFPVGAVGGRADVMAVFDPRGGKPLVPHGGTFNANPITMTAGLAAMHLMTLEAYGALNALGDALRSDLTGLFAEVGVDVQVAGRGSLLKFHMHGRPLSDYRSGVPSAAEARAMADFHRALLSAGIVISPDGLCALSTVMTSSEVDSMVASVREAYDSLSARVPARAHS